MAACNPYNILSKDNQFDDELECQFEENEQRDRRLSHRVNPLKPSLLDIVWDFEALSAENEKEYIKLMIKGKFKHKEMLTEIIYTCHNKIKNDIEKNKSSVSLRDIERINKIFHFSIVLIKYLREESRDDFDEKLKKYQKNLEKDVEDGLIFEALFVTIAINYYFRLYKNGKFGYFFKWKNIGKVF
jgi:hypothetical protein